MKILGMDLGTTNTYIYWGNPAKDAGSFSLPKALVIEPESDSHGSIATSVLYENGKPIAIGNVAEEEFNIHGDKSEHRFLASQFKPEIAKKDSLAQKWMRDFLLELKKRLPAAFIEEEYKLFVGIPSLAREDFSLNLGRCFVEAGWNMPNFVRESDAAVVSCLQAGTLSIQDMEYKSLILDFGGGTCDFTAIEGLEILQNGGDTLYGGRLFDDLIFQHFIRQDQNFAATIRQSPISWFVHWVECRKQKENFSDFLKKQLSLKTPEEVAEIPFAMHLNWLTDNGQSEEAYIKYTQTDFLGEAENYQASEELLNALSLYQNRGGISPEGRDLLQGHQVGLISWLRKILESVDKKNSLRKIVLTGGSARWYFAEELCSRLFPHATCLKSKRSYEDIAFGLALFPVLQESRKKAKALLERNLPEFTQKAVILANRIITSHTGELAELCANHIVERDITPCLESGAGQTLANIEARIRNNIMDDQTLLDIVHKKSELLNKQIQDELEIVFRRWLMENGVPLTPNFQFPGKAISNDFFIRASKCITNLDLVKITRLAITAILPLLAGGTAAHFLAPVGEPVSIGLGIGVASVTAWFFSKTAPQFMEKIKIPAYFLNDKRRVKVINNIHKYIRNELDNEFAKAQSGIAADVEKRLSAALDGMVNSLNILNQIQIS